LVAIDQEGGTVHRLEPPFTQLPGQREMIETLSVEQVRQLGRTSGRELSDVGINFNLAPVLDLWTDPQADYMADRSFGADPNRAAELGLALIDGHAEYGVLTCAKHFPGIGDTRLDPHEDLPVVPHPAHRLQSVEMKPFVRAINAGVPAVMTSHVIYPGLDPHQPATFSNRIQTYYLRQIYGFTGLILTDDLEMGAIVKNFQVGPAAVKAVSAGADMVLVCRRAELIRETRTALIRAVNTGDLAPARLEASSARSDAALSLTVERSSSRT
jgi:beta-N-acetylhexosaminidase